MTESAVVFVGGDPPGAAAVADLPTDRFVVAADSGYDHALALGVAVDVLVGDLDSVTPAALADAEARGVDVQRHPTTKDETDLELAMGLAVASGAPRLLIIGGHGGRIDHWLGNVATWTSPRFAEVPVEVRSGTSRLFVVRDHLELIGTSGEYVTLLAWNGPADGVRTTGLRWALDDDRLDAGSSRGVSNELVAASASVSVASGTLLVIRPGEAPDPT